MIIAIDGPAGSGKSTIAKSIAQKLNFLYIDTGAMYRAVTLKAIEQGISFDDGQALLDMAKRTTVSLCMENQVLRVFLDGQDVTEHIRTPDVTNKVFYVADNILIRQLLVEQQRKLGAGTPAVLEGRDTTSVVFPDADIKIFLDASFEERVERRWKEFRARGKEISREKVKEDLRIRDTKDFGRNVGGLKKVPGAFVLDTTGYSISEVEEQIIQIVKNCKTQRFKDS